MKRLLADFHQEHPGLEVIFTEDAFGAKGPYLRRILEIGAYFIVNVNPSGNSTLFDWIKGISLEKKTIATKTESIELQFYNKIPLNDATIIC